MSKQDAQTVVIPAAVVVFLLVIFYQFPIGIDWQNAHDTARDIWHYERYDFIGLPITLFFVPHVLLPIRLGGAVNLTLNFIMPMLVIYKCRAGLWAILAVYLCPPFYVIMTTNNIEWLALVGFLLPPHYGAALIALKPQSIGAVIAVWIKEHGLKVVWAIPVLAIIVLALWGLTPLHVMKDANVSSLVWNYAPFPFLIPAGLFLIAWGYKNDDMVIAACATPLLVPYIAGYTLPVTITVLATKYPKIAALITLLLWWILIVETRRYG